MYILSVSEKILFFICGFGILQGVLLAGLLYLHPKSDRSVNFFLALYIFSTSLIMSLPLILQAVGWQNAFWIQPVPLLPGPFLYLYMRSLKERISWRKALPHFIPFFAFFFISYWNMSYLSRQYPDAANIPGEVLNRPLSILLIFVKPMQGVVYYFLARKTLLSYQHSIRHLFSDTSHINLNWARFLTNGYLVLVLTFVIFFPIMMRYPEQFNLLLLINMAIATPYIYGATYKGFMQLTIWQVQPGINKEAVEVEMKEVENMPTTDSEKPKVPRSTMNEGKVDDLINKIILLMEQEKIFQEPELTLHQVAGKLQTPTYQVSQALNEGMKKSFYDLVNGYRVEESKRLLLDSKNSNYTILSVGFEAGFNSKTTFNTVFKKFTGLTPTEYRDKQRTSQMVS